MAVAPRHDGGPLTTAAAIQLAASIPNFFIPHVPLPAAPELAGIVKGLAKSGDLVVCLGAGNITQWAYALPGELKALG